MSHWRATHWGQVTHICVRNLTTIRSDNGMLPCRRQAIIWTKTGISLIIGFIPKHKLQLNLNRKSSIFIQEKSFAMPSVKLRPFCLGLYVFKKCGEGVSSYAFHPYPGPLQYPLLTSQYPLGFCKHNRVMIQRDTSICALFFINRSALAAQDMGQWPASKDVARQIRISKWIRIYHRCRSRRQNFIN